MRRAWEHLNPTRVVFGPGVVRELERVEGDHVLLLCSPGAAERGLAGRVAALIGEQRVRVHARVAANPAVSALDESIAELRDLPVDAVVGLGGGSAIDTAKVLSASLANGGADVRELLERAARDERELAHVPLVAVPTTAGSGSEVTPFATVWSPTEPRKLSLASPSLFPAVAVVDPELAIGLDWEQTLSTGLDAFVQCFEAIWNRNATPVASAVAERGLTIAPNALRRLKREPHAVTARTDLAEAALLSGLAISQTRTALAHSLSYPITAHFRVPHGLACALVLPAVLEFNLEADDGRLARVADRLGLADPELLVSRVLGLYRELGVAHAVRRHVDDLERLEELAPEMLAPGRAELNLRATDIDAVRGILRRTHELLAVEVPGVSKLGFLKERRTVKEFESLDPSFHELVFYSEGAGDWPHLGPVVEALLRDHDRTVTYLSSDPADPGLAIVDPRLRSFMIGSGTVRTILFARIDCRHFVMTLPDLDQLWLKRSAHPVHYVYLFHSMNSTHAAYRADAFDAYDTVLCVGPYQVEEIRRAEELRGLPAKELVEHGSVKLDTVLSQVALASDERGPGDRQVLVAPSWGDCSLIERPVGTELLDVLVGAGYRTILRLHPMTVRRLPELVESIRARYANQPLFVLEEDMNAIESWMRSDVMISDWSGAALEYAFALQRPVLYVDTPQKAVNPDWQDVGIVPFEDVIRREIGHIVREEEIERMPAAIEASLSDGLARRERVLEARDRYVFNPGESAKVAADYLAGLAASRSDARVG